MKPLIIVVLILCLSLFGCAVKEDVIGDTKSALDNSSMIVTMRYNPEQCTPTPWADWYTNGNIEFLKEPSSELLIKTYYGQEYGIDIKSLEIIKRNNVVCQACGCPESYYVLVNVTNNAKAVMEKLGWTTDI